MKNVKSIRYKFRATLVSAVLMLSLVALLFIGIALWHLGDQLAKGIAKLYTESLVEKVESQLDKELSLVSLMSRSFVLKDWLNGDQSPETLQNAYTTMKAFEAESGDRNVFWVSTKNDQVYFSELQSLGKLKATGLLKKEIASDAWYFDTLKSTEPYNLEVDKDRFLESLRIWINYKVYDENELIGVVGTGITIENLVSKVFNPLNSLGANTVIVDRHGNIQLYADHRANEARSMAAQVAPSTIFDLEKSPEFSQLIKPYLAEDQDAATLMVKGYGSVWNRYVAIAPIHQTDWYVVSLFSIAGVMHPSNFIPVILLVLVMLLLLGGVIDLTVRRIILKPFYYLIASLKGREMGEENPLYGVDRPDEFGDLVRSIEEMSERMVASVPIGLFQLDENSRLIYANPYCLEQLGFHDSKTLGETLYHHPECIFHLKDDYVNFIRLSQDRISIPSYETQLKNQKGDVFWAEIRLNMIDKQDGKRRFEGILLNIQIKKDYEFKLMSMATKDPLTGLYNRYFFEQFVLEEVVRSERFESALSMVIVDLDHFKLVNDAYGHDVGDIVLKNVANVIKQHIRDQDKLVRWGGEEFALLLPDTNNTGAMKLAEKLRTWVAECESDRGIKVTASFGVAEKKTTESATEWFRRADQALLSAKADGRNCVRSAETLLTNESPMRVTWMPQFVSGNQMIDEQHKHLFETADRLLQSALSEDNIETPHKVYQEVVQEIEAHLTDEEGLLESLDYPLDALNIHREKHRALREQMKALEYAMALGTLSPSDVFMRLIDEMIMKHMLIEDLKFFSFLQKQAAQELGRKE